MLTNLCSDFSARLTRPGHTVLRNPEAHPQPMNIRRIAAVGGALVVLGVAAVSVTIVQAQTAPTPTTKRQNLADNIRAGPGERLHVTVDQLKQAMQDARKDAGCPTGHQAGAWHAARAWTRRTWSPGGRRI